MNELNRHSEFCRLCEQNIIINIINLVKYVKQYFMIISILVCFGKVIDKTAITLRNYILRQKKE